MPGPWWLLSTLSSFNFDVHASIYLFFVELRGFLVELRARAITQSSAKNHGVTQSDN